MVSACPSPVGNYRNLFMSVLSVIGFDGFVISSRFRALTGEVMGYRNVSDAASSPFSLSSCIFFAT